MKTLLRISPFSLKLNPENPRIIKDEKYKKLVKSIKEAPWMLELRPIVVNNNKMVLGGNMRLKACMDAKLKEIPVLIANELSEQEQKEFIIKDNVAYGEWDLSDLANWPQEELENWGLEIEWINQENKKEEKDNYTLADENNYTIIINCQNELEQKSLYEELEKRGFPCKLMM